MNRKIIINTAVILLLVVSIIGISYAYFTADLSGNETATTITVTGGEMTIAYAGGSNIVVNNIIPSDEVVATKTFTVTGTNTTTLNVPYTVMLVVDSNTFSSGALRYTLTSSNTSSNGEVVPSITGQTNFASGANSYTLGSGHFENSENAVHAYVLKLYFPNSGTNQNTEQGKELRAHISMVAAKAE